MKLTRLDVRRMLAALVLPMSLAAACGGCADESSVRSRTGRDPYQDNTRGDGSRANDAPAAHDLPGKGRGGEHKLSRYK
jgi:hypothetical protein